MTIKESLEQGNVRVEIDDWGGCHFHYDGEMPDPLSLSPHMMRRIADARERAREDGDSA